MIVGIDLGTTNSLVAVWRDGKAQIIPNALGENLTPSVVGLDDDGQILVGKAAKERLITHPGRTVANIKRYMGTEKILSLDKQKTFRAEELSALILRALKADAEAYLQTPVTEAVITVPAYFNDTQRKATKIAGELAGLKVERLLNEPTAAALAYGLHQKGEGRYLIFDLGGGTFDVSIVEYFEGILQVHASAGDNFLGGEDFVEKIFFAFLDSPAVGGKFTKDTLDPITKQILWRKSVIAKHKLSAASSATIEMHHNGNSLAWNLTETDFEKIAAPLLTRIESPIRRALRDSKFKVSDLDQIVLVGGATRMPIVRKLATRLFKRFPAIDIDPDQVVAIGAAIQAGLKARDGALGDTVMTDVSPYSLGIEISQGEGDSMQSGYFLPIIERNSFVPISRIDTVVTAHDNQSEIVVKVYQGESMMVKDNIYLSSLRALVPKRKRGEEAIDVRFTYDINGLLEVEVMVRSTQNKSAITIEKNPGMLSPEEISARLKLLENLKIHPRDQLPNQALISRAERLYEESLADKRQYLSHLLTEFKALLSRQNETEIKDARQQLETILNELDNESVY